jgi:hypothetical protein
MKKFVYSEKIYLNFNILVPDAYYLLSYLVFKLNTCSEYEYIIINKNNKVICNLSSNIIHYSTTNVKANYEYGMIESRLFINRKLQAKQIYEINSFITTHNMLTRFLINYNSLPKILLNNNIEDYSINKYRYTYVEKVIY